MRGSEDGDIGVAQLAQTVTLFLQHELPPFPHSRFPFSCWTRSPRRLQDRSSCLCRAHAPSLHGQFCALPRPLVRCRTILPWLTHCASHPHARIMFPAVICSGIGYAKAIHAMPWLVGARPCQGQVWRHLQGSAGKDCATPCRSCADLERGRVSMHTSVADGMPEALEQCFRHGSYAHHSSLHLMLQLCFAVPSN